MKSPCILILILFGAPLAQVQGSTLGTIPGPAQPGGPCPGQSPFPSDASPPSGTSPLPGTSNDAFAWNASDAGHRRDTDPYSDAKAAYVPLLKLTHVQIRTHSRNDEKHVAEKPPSVRIGDWNAAEIFP
jgi:hypothetical protein